MVDKHKVSNGEQLPSDSEQKWYSNGPESEVW